MRKTGVLSNGKNVPVLFVRKEECCGCTACCAVCPRQAIFMALDEEGFEYPQVDADRCVGCRMCIAVCPCRRDIK